MAKTKKNRRNIADKVRSAKAVKEKKLNPFELRINKQKHVILGRNNTRGQVGNPGQSRAKATKHRTQTLLVELKQSKKSNVFKDQRLGEKIKGLSQEDKTVQRLALERKTEQEKRAKQAEEGVEEELTHLGQSVSQIEQFDDVEADSDSDDGRLGGKISEELFGGFLKEKKEADGKTWKERMADMISQTRKEKYERQAEKDSVRQQTEDVDADFKAIHDLMMMKRAKAKEKMPGPDDYDIKVRMLQMEGKAQPTDRLKTEEELAKDEAVRLQKLEADRKRRMKGELASHEAPPHMSADSLDDGFDLDHTPSRGKHKKSDSVDKEESEDDDEESADSEGGSDEDGDDDEEDDDENEEDSGSDLQSDDEDDEEADKAVEELLKQRMEKKKALPKPIRKNSETATADPEEQKKIAEAAKQEIPYTFEAPSDLEGLVSLLSQYSHEDQLTVVERLVACHHPSLAEGNKEKLQVLFSLLVQYLMELMMEDSPPVQLFEDLTPVLQQLLRHGPQSGSAAVSQLLLNRHDEFLQICQRRSGRGQYMDLDTMLLLKLVHTLYPTSDFKHPVVTPAFHFITSMLGQTPVRTEKDVAAGLYLCALCLEYVSLSKRYIPEVINFLHGILFLAARKETGKVEKVFPPFKPVGNFTNLLKLKEKRTDVQVLSLVKTLTADSQELDTDEFSSKSRVQSSYPYASHLSDQGDTINTRKSMCGVVKECVQHLRATLEKDSSRPVEALTQEKKKPQPLKLFEPKIEEVVDGRKKRKGTKEQLERQRLQHKIKREMKGALREIRKDAHFLARQQLKETMEKDAERKRKLKRLYADLSTQEGEVKALKRQKDRAST